MATKKIIITVPDELVEAARGLTDNIAEYAAEVLAERVRRDLLAEDLRRYEEEHGAFTEEEMAEADARLHGSARPGEHAG